MADARAQAKAERDAKLAEQKRKQEEAKQKREQERLERDRLRMLKAKLKDELGWTVSDISELIAEGVDLETVEMKKATALGFPYPFTGEDFETPGKNLPDAFRLIADESLRLRERMQLCQAINNYMARCPAETKERVFGDAAPAACETLKKLVAQDDDDTKDQDYDKVGIQKMAEIIAGTYRMVKMADNLDWCLKWTPYAFEVLDTPGYPQRNFSERTDKKDKVGNARRQTVMHLLDATPPTYLGQTTGEWTIGDVPDPMRILSVWEENATTDIKKKSQDLMKAIMTYDKEKAASSSVKVAVAQKMVDSVLGGDKMSAHKLAASMYDDEPKVFEDNIVQLLEAAPMSAPTLYYQISLKHPHVCVPATEFIFDRLASGKAGMMAAMYLNLLQQCARSDPDRVVQRVNLEWVQSATAVPNGAMFAPKVVGLCGRAKGKADEMMHLLGKSLTLPGATEHSIIGAIGEINNLASSVSSPRVLDDYIETIRSHRGSAAALVEKIDDWYSGRSLADAYVRLDELEEIILQMNDKVSSTCANFEEVKAYVDQNMAEMKEFVATIAKKLPQPVKLTVVTGIRKTLRLHFACVRTGDEWTCESKDWNKWMKVGFSVMKLGKCVLDIGMGNPLGLVKTGVDALSGVYKAFKDKDDEEFDKYITEPFLTSAEQDKLINQLRDGGFFEQFAYDAQAGGWVSLKAVSQEERDELTQKRDAKIDELKQNKETVKGKNLGFGSASDIAKGATAMAKAAGVDVVGIVSEAAGAHATALVSSAVGDNEVVADAVQGQVVDTVGDALEDKLGGDAETDYGSTTGTDSRKAPMEMKSASKSPSASASASAAASAAGGGSAMDRLIARRAAGNQDGGSTGTQAASASKLGAPAVGQMRDRVMELEKTVHKQQQQLASQAQRLDQQEETLQSIRAEVEKLKGGASGACCVVQ